MVVTVTVAFIVEVIPFFTIPTVMVSLPGIDAITALIAIDLNVQAVGMIVATEAYNTLLRAPEITV